MARVCELGKGALMAKMDICRAYRNIPVHPKDRYLLGMSWCSEVYVDATLPFGLRSAPLIFSTVADVTQWIMEQKGVDWLIHYMDDFFIVGPQGSDRCGENIAYINETCEELGLPIDHDKDEGPTTAITFLGMELDAEAMEVCLPAAKLLYLRAALNSWRGRKACRKRDLLSLIGSLSHASRAVRAGRSFVRRLIELARATGQLDDFTRLTREARADIDWWWLYVSTWNGTAMMYSGEATQDHGAVEHTQRPPVVHAAMGQSHMGHTYHGKGAGPDVVATVI